jgi:hypothetical protein
MSNLTGQGVYQKISPEVKRLDKLFLAWLRTLPCLIGLGCEGKTEAAHVTLMGRASKGMKPPMSAVPLCSRHHREQHQYGHERFGTKEWWINHADAYARRFMQLVR